VGCAVVFVGRSWELAELARVWASPGPQVHVLYGRRRVGKSALLARFLEGRPHVSFQAAAVSMADNLRAFMARAAETLGRPALAASHPADIEQALVLVRDALLVATRGGGELFGIVLDELPDLMGAAPGTASLIQRFLDGLPPGDSLRLFLCGSAIRVMEAEVLGQRSPLFGRRTAQLRLAPLPFDEWGALFPELSPRDRLWLQAATGGVPAYLAPVSGRATSARDALIGLFFARTAWLASEADFLLRTELSVLHTYASILRAIAAGATRLQEIGERAGVDGRTASRYLPVLIELGYVQRETSLDEARPEKSRKGRYRICDGLLRFHFRFVQPFRDVIERGDGAALFDARVAPQLPAFAGPVYEDLVRARVARRAPELFGAVTLRAGRLYGAWGEIDLALELMDGAWIVGECKATASPVGVEGLKALREKLARAPGLAARAPRLVLASLHGFTPALQRQALQEGVLLVEG